MKTNPIWPSSPSELVLWAQLICAWSVAAYAIAPDLRPIRESMSRLQMEKEHLALVGGVGLAVLTALALPPTGTSLSARIALLVLLGSIVAAVTLIRPTLRRPEHPGHSRRAEFEVAANLAAILGTGGIIGISQVGAAPVDPILRGGKAAAVACVVAALVFVFRGGTYLVRAILDKMSANPRITPRSLADAQIPPATPPTPTPARTEDTDELNRGRSIGNLERLLMVLVISIGHYEVLGFLIAAKGLIRAREFEDRAFAEYFILGNLTSAAVAMVVGLSLRVAVTYFWSI